MFHSHLSVCLIDYVLLCLPNIPHLMPQRGASETDKFTRTIESCGGKGTAQPLSQGESASEYLGHSLQRRAPQPLSLTGFYFFSGHITLRMVLIYYAQVCFGWLHLTENKGEDVAKYIKKGGYLQM